MQRSGQPSPQSPEPPANPAQGPWQKPQGAKRHGILVIHGIGEQRRGDTLHTFLNGFHNYLHTKVGWQKGAEGHGQIDLDTDLPAGQARVIFRDGKAIDEFLIREVWWAKTCPPLDFWRVLQWLIRHLNAPFRIDSRWRHLWTYLFLVWGIPALLLALLAVFAVLQFLQWWPFLRGPLNSLSQHLQKAASAFLVGSVGDVATYTMDLVYANEIRQVLEHEIDWMAAQDQQVDDIHIVAHSLGSLIAYEVLARTYRRGVDAGELKGRIRTFFSVGSPLDKVPWFLAPEHTYRFPVDFPDITWVNIYTAYDLVSDKLRYYGQQPQNVLVTNKEFPPFALLQDHSGYWRNFEVEDLFLRQMASIDLLSNPVKRPKGLPHEFRRWLTAEGQKEEERRREAKAPPPSP
ncbi:MAG: hypothetical protein WBF66_06995 [Dehalococcoidia bacterium]